MDQSLEIFGKARNQQPSHPRDNRGHQRAKTDKTCKIEKSPKFTVSFDMPGIEEDQHKEGQPDGD